ncbi:hypothetical protein H5A41_19455 [Pectobacterium versatile]|nr:contact-dependent growth inhibition system immunity protein [Pectobacterium versatile]MBN3196558.1 hypothetical protein [Pectobacterium versatile]
MTVEDLCCSVRQKVCLEQLMPRILVVLTENPLAGEYYDGELIASLSTINKDDLKNKKDVFVKIKDIINNLNIENLNNDLQDHILKIKKITL